MENAQVALKLSVAPGGYASVLGFFSMTASSRRWPVSSPMSNSTIKRGWEKHPRKSPWKRLASSNRMCRSSRPWMIATLFGFYMKLRVAMNRHSG